MAMFLNTQQLELSESWRTMDTASNSTLVDGIESCGGYPELLSWIAGEEALSSPRTPRAESGNGFRANQKLRQGKLQSSRFNSLRDFTPKVMWQFFRSAHFAKVAIQCRDPDMPFSCVTDADGG